ncbi:TIGR03943 family protein [Acidothermaceae bacterium B102]|nr:TIGR03943 family protein [Acidothermaceae bacterium B102]
MNRRTESLLLAAMGVAALILSLDGDALVFVRPGLVKYVFASGLVLVLLAIAPAVRRRGSPDAELAAEEQTEHDHHHSRRAPWFVMAPLLVLLVVAPGPLGASAASSAERAVVPQEGAYPAVGATVAGAVPMTLAEYTSRALDDPDHSLTGVRVRLTGFVAKAKDGDGFLLSRFTIFCCAADAEIQQILVLGSAGTLPDNTWVTVVGTWPPGSAPAVSTSSTPVDPDDAPLPELTATTVTQVKRPHAPYEYTLQYAD